MTDNTKKYIIYIDMDDTIFNYNKAFIKQRAITGLDYPQSLPGFFENLEPLPFAIEAVNKIRHNPLFDVYILTAPSVKNPLSYTGKRLCIEKYFDYNFCEKLIISPNKSLLKGDLLIDDNKNGKGQDKFEGNLIHFGYEKYKNWNDVMKYIYAIESLLKSAT